ncbi:hypothetical protein [uncultured Pedobacter sp.]|nr:hypothetical protein [uncultured Pedobacter sp.]
MSFSIFKGNPALRFIPNERSKDARFGQGDKLRQLHGKLAWLAEKRPI